jgi:hypothetical protein
VLTNRSRHFGGGAIKLRIRGELPVCALSSRWNINRNHIWMKRNIVRENVGQQLHEIYLMNSVSSCLFHNKNQACNHKEIMYFVRSYLLLQTSTQIFLKVHS